MKFVFVFILQLILANSSVTWAQAQCSAVFTDVVYAQDYQRGFTTPDLGAKKILVPKYLFSWTSALRLDEQANNNPQSSEMPMKPIRDSFLVEKWPYFKERPGIFAWTHPTGALGTEDEVYARFDPENSAPRMIVMQLAKDAKIIALEDDGDKISTQTFDGVDVVLHRVRTTDIFKTVFDEWIVLNPKKINWFSADPADLPEPIRREMLNSIARGFKFSKGELFFPESGFSKDIENRRKIVRAYLRTKSGEIPKRFSAKHL